MPENLYFTVDSALLEELGERLVGKPYIALAELVKNSYDADATKVTIELNPEKNCVIVTDNGHGMTFKEFEDFWMRIGSTHKRKQRISRNFGRSMTGSKGVGRLAVQYLAKKLTLFTTSEKDLNSRLEAYVNWEEAVKAGELTQASVEYEIITSEEGFEKGTQIVLMELKHDWSSSLIQGLAQEIWWLQPPFRSHIKAIEDLQKAFEITFISSEKDYEDVFNKQIKAIMDIWHCKLVGRNINGKVSLSLEYAGEIPSKINYTIPNCDLSNGDFEIRIYHLTRRQPHHIKVGKAREYFNQFGGVHVYDGGFHLPYYGDPRNDWLMIELAHSHRLTLSQLLPKEFQIKQGLQFLPTLSRIFGAVNVDTSKEKGLHILITRDRLQESVAFDNLAYMVRWALDYYSYVERVRTLKLEALKTKTEKPKHTSFEEVLVKYQPEIPENVYDDLYNDIQKVTNEIESEAEEIAKRVSLMGPLATAGITSLAYQHETKRQFFTIEDIIEQLGQLTFETENEKIRSTLNELKQALSSWLERSMLTNSLFSYYIDSENLRNKKRFQAKKIIDDITQQVTSLARGIPIDTSKIDEGLLLPEASLVEWSSIFQNVFINSFNAMIDSENKFIEVSSRNMDRTIEIIVQNTGSGVNLKDSEILFEPFERRVEISSERRALGYGGTGLGLTIVRLIAYNIGCKVSFVEPQKGFNTAFSLKWRELE